MACAFKMPDRLHTAGLISSFAPYDRPNSTEGMANFNKVALGMAHRTPWLGKPFMRIQGRMNALRSPDYVLHRQCKSLLLFLTHPKPISFPNN